MLVGFGLCMVPDELCLFTRSHIVILFYIDDIILIYPSQLEAKLEAQAFKTTLLKHYVC